METMNSWERKGVEIGLEQGLEKGLEQGLERGRHDAAYDMAVRFLELKIGTLPTFLTARLHGLSTEQLLDFSEVALHANTVQDVQDWLDKRA